MRIAAMPTLTMSRALTLLALAGLTISPLGCRMKQTVGVRESGQSRLMDESFAAQNACNPEEHHRPFIIEWDATDMSSFESIAANDIVIVKYEGCKLRVLDECRNDSIRGSQGAYKPPEWTSGSLETLDIHNEGELYAKLPLGQATLGGRVAGGERFHMEYFVAGTVSASRDAVYRGDLESNPGCDAATHFVYGYNLGAFALGSANEISSEVGGSMYGFGAGGSHSKGSKAEKKGGDLSTCTSESATEVRGCKAPIRLNLRSIRDGQNPGAEALTQADTDASLTAAGTINQKLEMSDEARSHYEAAQQKLVARDGKGCLAELDLHDDLDPKHKSSDPKSPYATTRAQCVMMSGNCEAGKVQARQALEATSTIQLPPQQIDQHVEAVAMLWCQGDSMSERDQLLQAHYQLDQSTRGSPDIAFCDLHWKKAKKLLPKVKPKNSDDHMMINIEYGFHNGVPRCYMRAGDCKKAYQAYKDTMPKDTKASIEEDGPEQAEATYKQAFESDSSLKDCRQK
jgi:hypothetical protein